MLFPGSSYRLEKEIYSLPSININLGSGSKFTFIEVLTINNYKIIFLSNVQILTFINISNCEESL